MNRDQVLELLRRQPADTTLAALVAWLRELLEEGPTRVPTAVPEEEEVALLLRTPSHEEDRLMFRTFYATGVRSAELRAFRQADQRDGPLFVRSGKYDADRYVLLDPGTREALRAWTAGRPPEAPLFPVSNSALQRRFAKWSEACGLRQKYAARGLRLSVHSLRFAFATHNWRGGLDFAVLQRLLGHQLASTTHYYVHSTVEEWAVRYQRALGREQQQDGPPPPPSPGGSPRRDEVIAYVLAHPAPDLEAILELLARWQLELASGYHREFMQQLEGEVPAHELLGGRRLPLILSRSELAELLEAGGLVARFLYRSLAFASELPGLGDVHPETGIVRLRGRHVVVDPATARALLDGGPLDAAPLAEAAERTGLAARFRALDRAFTPNCLRHTGATHLLEAGLDANTLHELLGNESFATTEYYFLTAAARWLPAYLGSHPLARG